MKTLHSSQYDENEMISYDGYEHDQSELYIFYVLQVDLNKISLNNVLEFSILENELISLMIIPEL